MLLTLCWSWHPPVKPSGPYSPCPDMARSHQGSASPSFTLNSARVGCSCSTGTAALVPPP